MKNLTLLSLFLFIYSSPSLAADIGSVYQMSRTIDFVNLDTKQTLRVSKPSVNTPYYLKVLNKSDKYYDVIIVDKHGQPQYDGNKLRVWKTYFDRGVYERTVDIIVHSTREIEGSSSPDFSDDCADCRDRERVTQPTQPKVEPLKPKYSSHGDCEHFADFLQAGVPKEPLQQALTFYKNNKSKFKKRVISIADYSVNSVNKRFYILNLDTGKVEKHKVSHGSGYDSRTKIKYGDANHDGMIDRCQSPTGSRENMTRPGFFKVSELYWSNGSYSEKTGKYAHRQEINFARNTYQHVIKSGEKLTYGWPTIAKTSSGYKNGLKMDGLSGSVNDHARLRGVVMHGAYYNQNSVMGRSYGCPAFTPHDAEHVLDTLTGGSLYYAFTPKCANDMKKVLRQVSGWQNTCK